MIHSPNHKKAHRPTVTVIQASGGELANQLWNYISIYAYCLEKGLTLSNPSFYEYGRFFQLPKASFFFDTFFFKPLAGNTTRKWSRKKKIWRKAYALISNAIIALNTKRHVHVPDGAPQFYLAPSTEHPAHAATYKKLSAMESTGKNFYLSGWLFRNPIGIEKYRAEIRSYFRPSQLVGQSVNQFLRPLRETYKNVVGVHIRQGDYATWYNGAYFIPQERVRDILREYLVQNSLNSGETCFVIASDGPIKTELFSEFTIKPTGKGMVEDLFILAGTDAVIGSNSTFGDFASYYGNIPHIIFEKTAMDWAYYSDKKSFFPNKYCSWVHY